MPASDWMLNLVSVYFLLSLLLWSSTRLTVADRNGSFLVRSWGDVISRILIGIFLENILLVLLRLVLVMTVWWERIFSWFAFAVSTSFVCLVDLKMIKNYTCIVLMFLFLKHINEGYLCLKLLFMFWFTFDIEENNFAKMILLHI